MKQYLQQNRKTLAAGTGMLMLLVILLTVFSEGRMLSNDDDLPLWSVLPFAGMLLSIALFPLINANWWEKNMGLVSTGWALLFFVPFLIAFGRETALSHLLEVVFLDYLPFIVLLFGLFVVSGGIILRGDLKGRPSVNVAMLGIGTLLASWIGTTGASMLLIRPLIRANGWRKQKAHILVFFNFLVAILGGSLTPLGDPPLFLGFLRGVPFFWTLNLILPMSVNALILLTVYYFVDRYFYRKEMKDEGSSKDIQAMGAGTVTEIKQPLRIEGLRNLAFLAMIIGAVILSGVLSKNPWFFNEVTGELKGITLLREGSENIIWPYINILRDMIILMAAFLSIKTTPQVIRRDNCFTWAPIKEVAVLFIGIFVTMIPALILLHTHGSELGLSKPMHFFWATGVLSSFLDNAPTYMVFMTAAASLGAGDGIVTSVGTIAPELLLAVSCGAVFMGANTYIGNAPNFMVRAIAEENKIKMPGFFGYMLISLVCLIPLFILDTFLFFR